MRAHQRCRRHGLICTQRSITCCSWQLTLKRISSTLEVIQDLEQRTQIAASYTQLASGTPSASEPIPGQLWYNGGG
ncbi:hypothetical protein Mapa_005357 [Marchantia paleacea]|nr:hypothetical protein Mapa_005357 [Marchantia paleacea]